jgi:hypothetical protein
VSVPRNAFTIISNSVQQNYRIAVVVAGMNEPTLERDSVSGGDRHFLQFSAEISSHGCGNRLPVSQRKALKFKTEIGYDDASENR